MAEKAEKTKQAHKMQLYTTKVLTPQDLLYGLLSTCKTVLFTKSF